MRIITDHIVEGDSINHQIEITVTDEPGQGGANHKYEIRKPHGHGADFPLLCSVNFQNGPIKEVGVNGITQEALIAICMDRLRSFQKGPFACDDNQIALDHLRLALRTLQNRTRARIARGVEGTNTK
jgi:hypothetical protein